MYGAGRMIFQGPREDVVPFFKSQHFTLLPRKGVADFLQEIVSPNDQEVRRIQYPDLQVSGPAWMAMLTWEAQ